jgi:hypothetical protein
VSFFGRMWARLRGKESDPTIGAQIAIVGGVAATVESQTDDKSPGDAAPDYGWSGDHPSGGSDSGGGGGFDGGGGIGDLGGGGSSG